MVGWQCLTEHVQSRDLEDVGVAVGVLSEAQRRAVLERAVDAYVQERYKLESLSSWQAVVTRRQRGEGRGECAADNRHCRVLAADTRAAPAELACRSCGPHRR